MTPDFVFRARYLPPTSPAPVSPPAADEHADRPEAVGSAAGRSTSTQT